MNPSSNPNSAKLWQGRTDGQIDQLAVTMGESISLDIELYREDLRGSLAHARMLHKINLLSAKEMADIHSALKQIQTEIENRTMTLRADLEDIHTHIETRLIELIGDTGKKLHTARSRNDQIALDTHLFVRRASAQVANEILLLMESLLQRANENIDTIIAGYTHLQVAQPVRLSHHLLAHFWSYEKDLTRFRNALKSAERLPLGSGAMAGVNYPTDRNSIKEELNFQSIAPNSMEAVASRDHILDFLYAVAGFLVHASREAEEMILWNSVEFSFIALPDQLTTGSSLMPQKKNPDFAELTRGKTGRGIGHLMNLLTNLKGLPFTYNRDMQEDRFPLIDAHKQCMLVAPVMTAMNRTMTFHPDRMRLSLEKGYATATDLADALVHHKAVPFREAHHLAGRLVAECSSKGYYLSNVPSDVRNKVSEHFADDGFYRDAVDLEKSADKKISEGGTARTRQLEQLELASQKIKEWRSKDWRLPNMEI